MGQGNNNNQRNRNQSGSNSGMSRKDKIREKYSGNRDMSRIKVIPANPAPSLHNPTTRKNVVVYARVSTDNAEQTSSFELQKNYYLRMVRKRPDWKLVGLYADEGLSATGTEKRIGLLTMLADAREGKFDIIICKNTSRLCRNLMDCMDIVYELRALPHPVGILFESENLFTLDKGVDMTLHILSLIAQEESRLKSDSMKASVKQRFSQGNFLTPAPMGFDNDENGDLIINEEEASTVRIISLMYLSGIPVKGIIGILENLGRRTKTRKLRDGTVKEGSLKWSVSSVLGVLKNERICGDVLAQKTWTPNYLDHKAKKNCGDLPQYYETDHHDAIISHEHYDILQRMMWANKGAQNMELPTFSIQGEGPFRGYVSTVPQWRGFTAEDYNRAGLRAFGVAEELLQTMEEEQTAAEEAKAVMEQERAERFHQEFRNQYFIDSDDYQNFPDVDEETMNREDNDSPCFARQIESIRENRNDHGIARAMISNYDLSHFELVSAEMFSFQEKVCILLDQGGITFNKTCLHALNGVEDIELLYNPLERALIVKESGQDNRKSMHWVSCGKGRTMRRCQSRGLCDAIYINMHWNADYKYRLIGMPFVFEENRYLFFSLERPITVVKMGSVQENLQHENYNDIVQTENLGDAQRLADEYYASHEDVVDVKRVSRSLAIYYDDHKDDRTDGEFSIAGLGNEKYDADFICEMMQKGITPKEGWHYLDGMMKQSKSSIQLYPSEMADSYGQSFYDRQETVFLEKLRNADGQMQKKEIEYGWTVGLDIPSRAEVSAAIEQLRLAAGRV